MTSFNTEMKAENLPELQTGIGVNVGKVAEVLGEDAPTNSLDLIFNPDNMEKVEVAIKEELELLIAKGITGEELANAQKGYLEQQEVSRTSDASLAGILTTNLFAERDMTYYIDLEKKINAVTAEAAQKAFAKFINPKDLIITVSGSLKK